MRHPANVVEIAGCISTDLFFILMIMGTAPITSITAKSVNVTVNISAILNMRSKIWEKQTSDDRLETIDLQIINNPDGNDNLISK